jgi:hypothetical protein
MKVCGIYEFDDSDDLHHPICSNFVSSFCFCFFPKTEFHSIFPTFQPYFHSFQYFPMIFMIFYQHFPSFPSFPKLSVIFLGCFPSFFQRFIAIAGPPPRSSRLQRRELAQKGLAQLRGAAKLAVEGGAKQTRWARRGGDKLG